MKKLFTLLTLLVAIVTGAWGESEIIFSMTNINVTENVSVASGEDHTITTSEATILGGTAKVHNGKNANADMLTTSKQVTIAGSGASYFHVSLSGKKIAKGDIIAFGDKTGSGYIAKTSTKPSSTITVTSGGYIVPEGSELIGQTEIYFWKPGSGDVKAFTEFTVTRPESSGKTTLAGAWSDVNPTFAIGSTATIPTFEVTGGGTLGEDYTIAYTKTDENSIVTLANGGISAISTENVASATVTATVTIIDTENFEIATNTYECAISVIDAVKYSTPTITEKNGTVQITSPDDGVNVNQIRYSLDGGTNWNNYSIPFNLNEAKTVQAKVVKGTDPSYTDSDIASAECNAIPAAIAGSRSITLYNDATNWIKSESIPSSGKIDTWTGNDNTYLEGYKIVLDNENQEGSNIKELSTGNAINQNGTIKGSNGRTLIFTLPTGVKVNRITIYSYTNGDDQNHYASGWRINGSQADMIGLSLRNIDDNNGKSVSSTSNPDVRVFAFDTPLEGQFTFTNSGYQQCFYMMLDYIQTVSANISAYGYATFSSTYALDLDNIENAEAYIVTSKSGNSIKLQKVTGKVAANTGLILKSNDGGAANVTIPVTDEGTVYNSQSPTPNYLFNIDHNYDLGTSDNGTNYVLTVQNEQVVFAPIVDNDHKASVKAGQAALWIPASAGTAKALTLSFADDITGINEVSNKNPQAGKIYYNLQGQRVSEPKEGIYVVEGKKVLVNKMSH